MNFPRVALAATAAWVCDIAYGVVVYDWLLADLLAEHAHVFRPPGEWPRTLGHGAVLVGFLAFAYMYAKGYEGGRGVQEGVRFGTLVGLIVVCFAAVRNYVFLRLSPTLAVYAGVAGLVELALMGALVGYVYRPLPRSSKRFPGIGGAPGYRRINNEDGEPIE